LRKPQANQARLLQLQHRAVQRQRQTAAEPKLVGIAAWNKLIGNSITGTEDGKTLTEYYAADGTAKSMLGNDISTGTWMLVAK